MAPKTKGKLKEIAGKDSRFVNEEAEALGKELMSLPFIYERGFQISSKGKVSLDLTKFIQAMGWSIFCHPREEAVLTWVYEFYANARFANDRKVWVRGKLVDYSRKAINDYFELTDYENDEYDVVRTTIPPDDLASYICCIEEPEWANRTTHALKAVGLSRMAKVWHLFVNASILPTKHLNNLSLDKVALIFSIMRRDKINVGKIISEGIHYKVFEKKVRQLWFPTLITELCRLAGVPNKEGDWVTKVARHITETVISKNIKVLSDTSSGTDEPTTPVKGKKKQKGSSTAGTSRSSTLSSEERIMGELKYIKEYQRVQHIYVASRLARLHENQCLLMEKAKIPGQLTGHKHDGCFDDKGYLLGLENNRLDPTAPKPGETDDEDEEGDEESNEEDDSNEDWSDGI